MGKSDDEFKASSSWVEKYKRRHGIRNGICEGQKFHWDEMPDMPDYVEVEDNLRDFAEASPASVDQWPPPLLEPGIIAPHENYDDFFAQLMGQQPTLSTSTTPQTIQPSTSDIHHNDSSNTSLMSSFGVLTYTYQAHVSRHFVFPQSINDRSRIYSNNPKNSCCNHK